MPLPSSASLLRLPAPGSAGLAALAEQIAAIPDEEVVRALEQLEKWPPGSAREMALALLGWRQSGNAEHLPEGEREPPYNCYRELAASMARGEIMPRLGLSSGGCFGDMYNLGEWFSFDPEVARAAVLNMPRDGVSRSAAVDVGAEKLDSRSGLEFFLKSGERIIGSGTATAWERQLLEEAEPDEPDGPDEPDVARSFLERLTLTQRDQLFTAMADSISNRDASDPWAIADLNTLSQGVLQTGEVTPGLELFFDALTASPQAADEVRRWIEACNVLSPAHEKALEILWAHHWEQLAAGDSDALSEITAGTPDMRADRQAVLDRMAPAAMARLTGSGQLSRALELLEQVRDPEARCAAVEAVYPAWLKADPQAASAALAEVPLTALEREQWDLRTTP